MLKQRINRDWMFQKEGADAWEKITLPHDAMIMEKRDAASPNGNAGGFFPGGTYLYQKNIMGAECYRDKCVMIEFEGIYMNSKVYLNDTEVGGRVYGYSNFYVDITEQLKIGEKNTLKVVVDNSKAPNSRWYSGSGIYRSVNLWSGEKSHILPEGVQVTTVSTAPALIDVKTNTVNAENMCIRYEILENDKVVATGEGDTVRIEIPNGKLWTAEEPNLYTIRTILEKDGKMIDCSTERFGIRNLAWSAEDGLKVNGKTIKLRGGCVHHDHGILGACAYDEAEYRRVKKLKELGYNAIRYSHNPAGKNFLDACDELGMYVLDESFDQWKIPQSTYDYACYFDSEWQQDVKALVSKDYNHPCVIMYCIGNEITDTGLPFGATISKMLSNAFHAMDQTRPITIAINSMLSVLAAKQAEKKAAEEKAAKERAAKGETEVKKEKMAGSAEVNDIITLLPKIMASITPESLEALIGECISHVDIVGYNYGQNLYEGTHKLAPERVILSSETFPSRMDSNWDMVMAHDYVIGDFMWTAWDYLGEAGVGVPVYGTTQAPFSKEYPCLSAGCGSVDLTGFPESQAYYSAVLWGAYQKPYIGVRPVNHSGEEYTLGRWRLTDSIHCWNWPGQEGKEAEIEIYSVGEAVELYKNGELVGKETLTSCRCMFKTAYEPGVLEAISFDRDGNELARETLATAGNDTKLQILPEKTKIKADEEDIVYIPIHLIDKDGILKMTTEKKINVTVEGEGKLLAVGSGNPETEEYFHEGAYTSYHGRVLAVVQSTEKSGTIKVTASSDGLESVAVEIQVTGE